jgi:putative methyltransferase (TIGR04325 family)
MLPNRQFVTLQNTQHTYNPYRVFDRERFVDGLSAAGYQLVESWENAEISFVMPYHPDGSRVRYTGMFLRLR